MLIESISFLLITQIGVSVNISQLLYHGEIMWLNPAEEQLAKGWKKGQGPSTLCFGELWDSYISVSIYDFQTLILRMCLQMDDYRN